MISLIQKIKRHKHALLLFLIFFVPRVIGLGGDVYALDAGRWDERSDRFIQNIIERDFEGTYQQYHPGVTVMWLTGVPKYIFYKAFEAKTGYVPTIYPGVVYPEWFTVKAFIAKIPLVFFISLILAFSSLLFLRMGIDKRYVYLFSTFLSLEPFFLGITRFYHMSGLEAVFAFGLIALILYYYHSKENKYLILAGVFLGLAFLTKISAIIILPFIGLLMFYLETRNAKFKFRVWEYISDKDLRLAETKKAWYSLVNSLAKYFAILGISAILFIALWPAMWVSTAPDTIKTLIFEGGQDTAFGNEPGRSFTENRFLYYFEMFFVRSLGVTVIALLASFYLIFKEKSFRLKELYTINLLFILLFVFVMAFPSKLKDRYLITAYPSFLICSTYALYYLYVKLKVSSKAIMFAAIGIYYALNLYAYYPAYSGYHTDLLGGYKGYARLDTIRNRGEYYLSMIRYLNERDGDEAYNRIVKIAHGEMSRSTQGYKGRVITFDAAAADAHINYYAPYYLKVDDEVPQNCEHIKSFGPRWPYAFEYILLFECPNPHLSK